MKKPVIQYSASGNFRPIAFRRIGDAVTDLYDRYRISRACSSNGGAGGSIWPDADICFRFATDRDDHLFEAEEDEVEVVGAVEAERAARAARAMEAAAAVERARVAAEREANLELLIRMNRAAIIVQSVVRRNIIMRPIRRNKASIIIQLMVRRRNAMKRVAAEREQAAKKAEIKAALSPELAELSARLAEQSAEHNAMLAELSARLAEQSVELVELKAELKKVKEALATRKRKRD